MKITKNFSLYEFTKTNHLSLLEENVDYAKNFLGNIRLTALALEDIRSILKSALILTSGVRCPKLNDKVGGSDTSDHLDGLAADVVPLYTTSIIALTMILRNIDKLPNVGKIIYEDINGKTWLHVEPRLNEDQKLKIYKTVDGIDYQRII